LLSPEIRAALKCDANELDSDSLVQAILRAGVDMLYNGGIGTYVRASDETDAEVGDPYERRMPHSRQRITRDQIVVEGGNLGRLCGMRRSYGPPTSASVSSLART